MANPGDKVKITTKDKSYEGILIPHEESDNIMIKLDSGYNVGIKKNTVKSMKVVEKAKHSQSPKSEKQKTDKKKPTIAILHTGGTVASKVDYKTGGVIPQFNPEEILGMFPELKNIANIKSELISNMWSGDMRFKHYPIMAKAIQKQAKSVDGIILTHGTDTLHYSSVALSFMLENLPIPVIMVGAQRSSDRGSTDALSNLVGAAKFIANSDFKGLAICMHKDSNDDVVSILPACKTRKMHSSRRDAFKPINAKPIADITIASGKINWIDKPQSSEGKFTVKTNMEEKVAILKFHPNLIPEQIELYQKLKYKGLVLEGTGLGNGPVTTPDAIAKINAKNLEAIQKLIKSGCTVVMTTQTLYGRVQMNVYAYGRELQKVGVIPGEDMLPETAFVKLAWLLGNHKKDTASLLQKNLRGEIEERTLYKKDFLD
tara:strand:+ start:8560 stop:9849 length:1290 start_codon:yes stop_codon:yes gene_type:complete